MGKVEWGGNPVCWWFDLYFCFVSCLDEVSCTGCYWWWGDAGSCVQAVSFVWVLTVWYSLGLVLLISSASVRSIPFLSFIEPIFACNVPLVSLVFLKRSLDFPILLFSSTSDVEAKAPVLWPPHAMSWLIGKDPDAGRGWGQEKGTTEEEMAGWHHRLDGHEFE